MLENKLIKSFLSLAILSGPCPVQGAIEWGPKLSLGILGGHTELSTNKDFLERHTLKGNSVGLKAGYHYNATSHLFTTIEGRFVVGDLTDSKNKLLEGSAVLGYNVLLANDTILSPYAGIGYHKRLIPGKNSSLQLTFFRPYLPVGIVFKTGIDRDMDVQLRAEYNYSPMVKLKTTFKKKNITVRAIKAHGVKTHLDFIKKLGGKNSLSFGPYFYLTKNKVSVLRNIHGLGIKECEAGVNLIVHF